MLNGRDVIVTLGMGGGDALVPMGVALAGVILLGVSAQWVAWRLRVPSILLLLVSGILVGPVAREFLPGILDAEAVAALHPDRLFGQDLLLAIVALSVGLILYEGGLTLRFREIAGVRRVVALLVSAGAAVTWVVAGLAAHYALGMRPGLAVLLGAILTVTGPTVIGPMLAHIRPAGRTRAVLKWEGIVIDPIGVLIAVLVFEVLLSGQAGEAAGTVALSILKTVVVGGGLGVAGALVLLVMLDRYWVPDELQNAVSLMLVLTAVAVANWVQEEAGLLSSTVMGIVLANQRRADVRHIIEFKENLRVLLISALFITLAARLDVADLRTMNWWGVLAFMGVIVLVARPLCVFVSTIGSGLTWREKVFLASIAPRGIVAAAGASVFGLELAAFGVAGAETLPAATFITIIGTVGVYSIAAPWAARVLGIADDDRGGVLIVGAVPWARALATTLEKQSIRTLLIDTNRENVVSARMAGLRAVATNILEEHAEEDLDLRGIGRVFAVTPNDEVNALICQRLEHVFGSAECFSLPSRLVTRRRKGGTGGVGQPSGASPPVTEVVRPAASHGRHLFHDSVDTATLAERYAGGWVLRSTTLSDEFTWDDYRLLYGANAVPMVVVSPSTARGRREVDIVVAGRSLTAGPGDVIIGLVNPDELIIPMRASSE